jgi:hypothetical protein
MPTDHIQPKQKGFNLFNSIDLYTNQSVLTTPDTYTTMLDIAYPNGFGCYQLLTRLAP